MTGSSLSVIRTAAFFNSCRSLQLNALQTVYSLHVYSDEAMFAF